MKPKPHPRDLVLGNARGKAVGILIALVLVLAVAGASGYVVYNKYYKKPPLQTRLASIKMREEVIRFTHDHVSTALYHNLVMMDDIVAMMGKETDRLKRIGKKFPNQGGIIASQTSELSISRDRLAKTLSEVTAKIEKMYVTWLVDRSEGIGQINSQRGTLTRQLADAIRGEAVLISRIRTNPEAPS